MPSAVNTSQPSTAESQLSLHEACTAGDVERVRELLVGGASVDARDENGHTALQCAVSTMRSITRTGYQLDVLSVVSTLVEHGAAWDSDCDASVPESETRSVGAALRVCVQYWEQQREKGQALTLVPIEVVARGEAAVQTYLKAVGAIQV